MSDSSSREVMVFSEAIKLAVDQRAGYLERACGGDLKLRLKVEALLQAHEQAGDFLEAGESRPNRPAGEKPGDRIGRYKLLQQIGEGGCGVVFMAEQDEPIRRRVALKIIKPGMDTKSVIARFEAERQALALMNHPGIAKVFDAGATESGRPYFVMELIRGIKITDHCNQHSLSTQDRLALFAQLCQAVQHAHQKGIIHRDIKPSNVLVTTTQEGTALPVVIDFGIAKVTAAQRLTDKTLFTAFEMLIGTPAYMSPEQADLTSVDVDTRTDIYSLGVLLYELLTGLTPFDTDELLKAGLDEIRRTIREQEPLRPSTRLSRMTRGDLTTTAQQRRSEAPKLIRTISGDLDWIVMKALEKDRTRRYETANGLVLDVQRYLANEPVSARPPSTLYKLQKTALRNKVLFASLAVIVVLLITGLIVVSASLAHERSARREADAAKAKAEAAASKSQQVTGFLEEMLEGVGPSVAMGRDSAMLRDILERTAGRIGVEMTNQPAVEAELRSIIGRVYVELGSYERAEEMHRSELALSRRLFGPESAEAAASLNNLGQAFWKQRKLAQAETTHLEALALRRKLFGPTNAEVAASLNNLSGVYRRQARLVESEALARQSLEIRRLLFGTNSLEAADTLHNLCVVLGDQGRREDCEAAAREMLNIRRSLLSRDHPLVAAALADLAWATATAGKLQDAESARLEALALQRKLLGETHPEVPKALGFLGQLLNSQGKPQEAYPVLKAALSIQTKLLGEDHPDVLETLHSLAWISEGNGNWLEAELAYQAELAGRRKRGDRQTPPLVLAVEGLGRILMVQGKLAEAEQHLREVLTPEFIRQPASAGLLALRADLLGRQARWKEAIADATFAAEYQPAEHYHYHVLAALLAVSHDRAAYEQLCRKALPVFADTTNPYVAERIAHDCLLLADTGVDLQGAVKMADKSVTLGNPGQPMPYSQAAKALSEYRLGHFSQAIEWAERPLTNPEIYVRAYAQAVLALAHWQLGQKDEARTALARGQALNQSVVPGRDARKISGAWVAWVLGRVLLDEAERVVQPVTTGEVRRQP